MDSLHDWSAPFKSTCDRLAFEAVSEFRADWLAERPIDNEYPEGDGEVLVARFLEYREPAADYDEPGPDEPPVAPFEPSEEDWCDFRFWKAMTDARRSIEARPTFLAKLGSVCDMFKESDHPDLLWLSERIGEIYDRARAVDATSGAQASDRWDAMEDARL